MLGGWTVVGVERSFPWVGQLLQLVAERSRAASVKSSLQRMEMRDHSCAAAIGRDNVTERHNAKWNAQNAFWAIAGRRQQEG